MTDKKYIVDALVAENQSLSNMYGLLKLRIDNDTILNNIRPGQFVQVRIDGSTSTFLRRPISVCNVEADKHLLWLLVRKAGEGTAHLLNSAVGTTINLVLSLGNGFTLQDNALLLGGGVGVAPLLYLGKKIKNPTFLLAAKSASDLLLLEEFQTLGPVYIATDDGSLGEKGLITQHSILHSSTFSHYACCGPMPMMKAVAKVAKEKGVECEVSLENTMACGLGACLCCVEDTKENGHVCVCTDGPVFNVNQLKWQ